MQYRIRLQMWLVPALLLTMGFVMTSAAKAQHIPRTAKVYVKMDFWNAPASQSAEAWHFDPNNNGVWTQLSNDPTTPTAPPHAQFKIKDLFLSSLMQETHVWFLGVPDIQVVTGSPGNFTNVSGNAAYSEMIDRMIFAADPMTADIGSHDPCGNRVWPIATGSELTPYLLYPHVNRQGGYGMRMVKEGLLESTGWLWKNPDNVEQADVYIEFTLLFDMKDEQQIPAQRHQDVLVSWISAGGGCDYNFCIAQGQETAVKIGTPFAAPGDTSKIVVAVPHVLDHTAALQLYWRRNSQNTLLIDTPINNSINHFTAHKCEPDGCDIAWHNHQNAAAGHLPVAGLSQVHAALSLDGPGLDEIFAVASFNMPPHTSPNPAPTNHRALYMVFWHGTIPQGGGN